MKEKLFDKAESLLRYKLSDLEKEIITYEKDKNLFLVSCAGSGKTNIIVLRIVWLIKQQNIDPAKIVFITYSKTSSQAIKQKLMDFLDREEIEKLKISPFRDFLDSYLREYITYYKHEYPKNYTLLDDVDKLNLLQHLLDEENINLDLYKLSDFITLHKIEHTKYEELINSSVQQTHVMGKMYKKYLEYIKKNKYLDYASIYLISNILLRQKPETKIAFMSKYDFIFFENFENIKEFEFNIFGLISKNKNIFASGDRNQVISTSFGERSAFLTTEFDKLFPDTKRFNLTQNFRSPAAIVEAANKLLSHDEYIDKKEKEKYLMTSMVGNGEDIFLNTSSNIAAEAKWIAYKINELKKNKMQLKDIAIIYNNSSFLYYLEKELYENKIYYKIIENHGFYQKDEIKNCICFLKVILNWSDVSFLKIINVPNRDINSQFIQKIYKRARLLNKNFVDTIKELLRQGNNTKEEAEKWGIKWEANKASITNLIVLFGLISKSNTLLVKNNELKDANSKKSIHSVFSAFLKGIKYDDYLVEDKNFLFNQTQGSRQDVKKENVREFLNSIKEWEAQEKNKNKNLNDYINEISNKSEIKDEEINTTISILKPGLARNKEFKCVFIVGLSKYVWPAIDVFDTTIDPEERKQLYANSRRFLYIAMTRSTSLLYLTNSLGYVNNDINYKKNPSPFLKEMGLEPDEDYYTAQIVVEAKQDTSLKVGDIIMHDFHGKGTIIDILKDTIRIAFEHDDNYRDILKNHESIKRGN